MKAKVDAIVIDTAHGHSANVIRVVKMVREAYPDLQIHHDGNAIDTARRLAPFLIKYSVALSFSL